MEQATIKATVTLEKSLWVVIFERTDKKGYAAARHIFGNEPTDPELYEFILANFNQLQFTVSQEFELVVKRKKSSFRNWVNKSNSYYYKTICNLLIL